jgi:hypothetical protein
VRPTCIVAVALVAGGATSAGALAALAGLRLHTAGRGRRATTGTSVEKGRIMTTSRIEHPRVVSSASWLAARTALLAGEKELTRGSVRVRACV